jgi:HEAT repeat protein
MQLGLYSPGEEGDPEHLPICASDRYYRSLDPLYPRPWWWRLGRSLVIYWVVQTLASACIVAWIAYILATGSAAQWFLSSTSARFPPMSLLELIVRSSGVLAAAAGTVGLILLLPARRWLRVDRARERRALARREAGIRLAHGYRAYLAYVAQCTAALPPLLQGPESAAFTSSPERSAAEVLKFAPLRRVADIAEPPDPWPLRQHHAPIVDDASAALNHASHGIIAVVAPEGMGKTTLLRRLVWEHAQARLQDNEPGGRVPVYLDLAGSTPSSEDITPSLTAFVAGIPGLDHAVGARITHALITGPSLLIVDGLDNLAGDERDTALHHLNELARRATFSTLESSVPRSPTVQHQTAGPAQANTPAGAHVSTYAAIQLATGLRLANWQRGDLDTRSFEAWELLPLSDPAQQEHIVEQVLRAWPARRDGAATAEGSGPALMVPSLLLAQLSQRRESAAWAHNPLLLTLAALGWAGSEGTNVATTQVRLYHSAVETLMRHHLDEWSAEKRRHVCGLATRAALALFRSDRQRMSLQAFEREIASRLPASLAAGQEWQGQRLSPGALLLQRSGLFIPAPGGEYVAYHASLLTYLAAQAIAHDAARTWVMPVEPSALLATLLSAAPPDPAPSAPDPAAAEDLLALAWEMRTSGRWFPLLVLIPGIWCAGADAGSVGALRRPDLAHSWVRALLDQPDDVGLLGLRLAASSVAQITGDDETITTIATATAERLVAALIATATASKMAMVNAVQRAIACLAVTAPGHSAILLALRTALPTEDLHVRHIVVNTLGILGSAGAPVTDQLRPLLTDPEWSVRRAAAEAAGMLGRAGAEHMDELLALLTDQNPSVRQTAAVALGQLGIAGVPVLSALTPRLADPNASTRRMVVVAIGALGATGAPALPNLTDHMVDPSVEVRQAVAHALGAIGGTGTPALRSMLGDSDWSVRRAGAEAVETLGPAGFTLLREVRALLADPDADVRSAAARAIGALGAAGATALPALRARLTDPDAFVRESAARAIGALGVAGTPAVPSLRAILDDPFEDVRRAAAGALGMEVLGSASDPVPRSLHSLLSYPDLDVRQTESMRALAPAATQLPPEQLAQSVGPMEEVRHAAAAAIGGLAATGVSVAADLQVLLADADPIVRRIGAEATGALGAAGAPLLVGLQALLTDLDPTVRLMAVTALSTFGRMAAPSLEVLIALLGDPYKDVRRAAVTAIGGLGEVGAPALPELRSLLGDGDSAMRQSVARAIGELGAGAAPALPDLLAHLADQDADVRHAAAVAIGALRASGVLVLSDLLQRLTDFSLNGAEAIAVADGAPSSPVEASTLCELTSQLTNTDRFVRQRAAEAIGALGSAGAPLLPNLRALLADRYSSVRRAAAMAIGAMGRASVDAGPDLLAAVADQDEGVTRAATTALATAQPESLDTLLPELRTALATGQAAGILLPIAQRRELDFYLALGPAARPFTERVVELLAAQHWSVRLGAAHVLGALPHIPGFALAALLSVRRHDPYATVRAAASDALDTILSINPDLPERTSAL